MKYYCTKASSHGAYVHTNIHPYIHIHNVMAENFCGMYFS